MGDNWDNAVSHSSTDELIRTKTRDTGEVNNTAFPQVGKKTEKPTENNQSDTEDLNEDKLLESDEEQSSVGTNHSGMNEELLLKSDDDNESKPHLNNHTTAQLKQANQQRENMKNAHMAGQEQKGEIVEEKNRNGPLVNGSIKPKTALSPPPTAISPQNGLDAPMKENVENIPPVKLVNGDHSSRCSTPDTETDSQYDKVTEQMNVVEVLKEDLRMEEAKLLTLRKILDSQRSRNTGGGKQMNNIKQTGTMPSLHPKQQQQQTPSTHVQIAPKASMQHANQQQAGNTKSSLQPGSQPVQKYYIQVGNQLVPAPPPAGSGAVYQSIAYPSGTGGSQPSYPQPQPIKPVPPKQTAEQKQSAAKAALRRQLEQTLLQIPPPRPPPADWKAIPNVNSMDFMMLVGLDEVVDSILDMDGKLTLKSALLQLAPYNPRICTQCKVDFSPCWKKSDKDESGLMICERCSLQNVKKELKAEHTSRLKSAFLKALKQEQEIEEKIKAGEEVNIGNLTGSSEKPAVDQRSTASSPVINSVSSNHTPSPQPNASSMPSHASSPVESRHQQPSHAQHRHQVVQHYPHHTSLVHQLHQQHIHQQQMELDPQPAPSSRHSSNRWHPYMPSSSSAHHHSGHHPARHRPYVSSSGTPNEGTHQEYYVVHHPQHASARWQRT